MKHFSWNYFQNTGQIDAYLLYKDCEYVIEQKQEHETSKEGFASE